MIAKDNGYHQVPPTPRELAQWRRLHPRQGPPYRVACDSCGERLWLSGLGWGSHQRGQKHVAARAGDGTTYAQRAASNNRREP